MASHWSEEETLDLFNISIKNYPKYVHLRNNNESEKFYDEKYFARFHNFGKNAKNIKNRIEGIQKKFRKSVKNLNLNNFKSGDIPDEIYKSVGSKNMFNTCFDYEKCFGKFVSSKEFIKTIETVSQSDYWKSIRINLQSCRNKSNQKSTNSFFKEIPQCDSITISSAESSPRQLKLIDYNEFPILTTSTDCLNINNNFTRLSNSSSENNFITGKEKLKRKRNNSLNEISQSKHQILSDSPINNNDKDLFSSKNISKVDVDIQVDVKTCSAYTQIGLTTVDKNTSTDPKNANLGFSEITFSEIVSQLPNCEINTLKKGFQDIVSSINNVATEQSKTNNIMLDISNSLKDLVNQRVVFLSCSPPINNNRN